MVLQDVQRPYLFSSGVVPARNPIHENYQLLEYIRRTGAELASKNLMQLLKDTVDKSVQFQVRPVLYGSLHPSVMMLEGEVNRQTQKFLLADIVLETESERKSQKN